MIAMFGICMISGVLLLVLYSYQYVSTQRSEQYATKPVMMTEKNNRENTLTVVSASEA